MDGRFGSNTDPLYLRVIMKRKSGNEDGQVFIQSYSLMQKVVPQIVEVEPRGCSVVNVSVIMSVYNSFSANNGWPSSHTFKGSPRWRRLTSWYETSDFDTSGQYAIIVGDIISLYTTSHTFPRLQQLIHISISSMYYLLKLPSFFFSSVVKFSV